MSINHMTDRSYIFSTESKGQPLNLRKIATMPTLHCFSMPFLPVPSVKEVISQIPQKLQNREIFFHTEFIRKFAAMPLPEVAESYGGKEKIQEIVQPYILVEQKLHLGETTFFELAINSLQELAIKSIILQINANDDLAQDSIKKLPLPTVLIEDMSRNRHAFN